MSQKTMSQINTPHHDIDNPLVDTNRVRTQYSAFKQQKRLQRAAILQNHHAHNLQVRSPHVLGGLSPLRVYKLITPSSGRVEIEIEPEKSSEFYVDQRLRVESIVPLTSTTAINVFMRLVDEVSHTPREALYEFTNCEALYFARLPEANLPILWEVALKNKQSFTLEFGVDQNVESCFVILSSTNRLKINNLF